VPLRITSYDVPTFSRTVIHDDYMGDFYHMSCRMMSLFFRKKNSDLALRRDSFSCNFLREFLTMLVTSCPYMKLPILDLIKSYVSDEVIYRIP